MFGYLLLLFIIVPALELYVLIEIGTHIGTFNTFFIIILTGIVGASLARLQGFFVLRKIQESLQQGAMPTEEMLDGLMILFGGIVLLTPGFITDSIGLLLLIPFTRSLIKNFIRKRMDSMVSSGGVNYNSSINRTKNDNDDIEDADFH